MQATTVAARGLAQAPYTIANFSLSLSAKAKTVPVAKTKLKEQIEGLNKAINDMKQDLGVKFVKNSVNTSSGVREDYEYRSNKHELVGYEVTYTYSFQTDQLDKVNDIFDVLTSLDKVRVANPHFGLKPSQRERLGKKALKNAAANVKARFESECEILGLNAADFEICSWETTYHDSQRGERVGRHMAARAYSNAVFEGAPIAAAAGGGGGGEIDLVSGLAEVVVNVEVGYARKNTQTYKAEVVKKPSLSQENQNHV